MTEVTEWCTYTEDVWKYSKSYLESFNFYISINQSIAFFRPFVKRLKAFCDLLFVQQTLGSTNTWLFYWKHNVSTFHAWKLFISIITFQMTQLCFIAFHARYLKVSRISDHPLKSHKFTNFLHWNNKFAANETFTTSTVKLKMIKSPGDIFMIFSLKSISITALCFSELICQKFHCCWRVL